MSADEDAFLKALLGPAGDVLVHSMNEVSDVMDDFAKSLSADMGRVSGILTEAFSGATAQLGGAFTAIAGALGNVPGQLGNAFGAIGSEVKNTWGQITGEIGSWYSGLKSAFGGGKGGAGDTAKSTTPDDSVYRLADLVGKFTETLSHGDVKAVPDTYGFQPREERPEDKTYGIQPGQEGPARRGTPYSDMAALEAPKPATSSPGAGGWDQTKDALAGLGSMAKQVTGTLGGMLGMGRAIQTAVAGFRQIGGGVATMFGGGKESAAAGGKPEAAASSGLSSVTKAANEAAAALKAMASAMRSFSAPQRRDSNGSVLPSEGVSSAGGSGVAGEAAEAGGGIGEALGGLGAMAAGVGMVVSALGQVVQASTQFVAALAPSAVEAMGRAMKDLQATIGEALLPVVTVATDAFREIAAVLLPVMEKLQPIIQQLAGIIESEVLVVFDALAEVLDALMPVFEQLADVQRVVADVFKALVSIVMATLIPVIQAVSVVFDLLKPAIDVLGAVISGIAVVIESVSAVFRAMYETVIGFVAGFMPMKDMAKGWVDAIKGAFQTFSKWLVLAAVAIADFVGATGFRAAIVKGLSGPKKKDATGKGAATDASFKSFSQLGNDIAQSSLLASGMLGEKQESEAEKFNRELVEAIKAQSPAELQNKVQELINGLEAAITRGIKGATTGAVWGAVESAAVAADKATGGVFGKVGRAFGY